MKVNKELYLLRSVQENNVLPLTAKCNARCIFCSHRQNPPDIEVYSIGELSLQKIEELADFLVADRPIVIGESVTRVIEGEPFFHSRIREVLSYLRGRFPATPIQITTNGSLLDEGLVSFLAELEPVRLYLSLNSSDPDTRKGLMGLQSDAVFSGIRSLRDAGITYYGSILALPWIQGWADLEQTLDDLSRWGAKMARVFLPGHTKYSNGKLTYSAVDRHKLQQIISRLQRELEMPVVLEPLRLESLEARVEGTLPASAAARAGIQSGDIIKGIDEAGVFSRVDAFKLAQASRNPALLLERSGESKLVKIKKDKGESSGLVMAYDIDPKRVATISRSIDNNRLGRVLLLASPLATVVIKEALALAGLDDRTAVRTVASHYLGGNIGSAGLLIVSDYLQAWSEFPEQEEVSAIFVPGESFDWWGRDLRGVSYHRLEEGSGKPVYLL
ncbi:MAG: radical SAM protein [Halanaerobium sp.]|nr:radical SAM protein [Halanaerobium sp.]